MKQRHNPNVVNLADRIETALGDTVDNYLEDSQLAFSRVSELPLDHGAIAMQEMDLPVFDERVVPSPSSSSGSRRLVIQPPYRPPPSPVYFVEHARPPTRPYYGPHHSYEDMVPPPGSSYMSRPSRMQPESPREPPSHPYNSSEDLAEQADFGEDVVLSQRPSYMSVESSRRPPPHPYHSSEDLVERDSLVKESLVSGEDVMSPGPTDEGMMSPGPSHSYPELVVEDSLTQVPEEVVVPSSHDLVAEDSLTQVPEELMVPLPRPHEIPKNDSWEQWGRTDL